MTELKWVVGEGPSEVVFFFSDMMVKDREYSRIVSRTSTTLVELIDHVGPIVYAKHILRRLLLQMSKSTSRALIKTLARISKW